MGAFGAKSGFGVSLGMTQLRLIFGGLWGLPKVGVARSPSAVACPYGIADEKRGSGPSGATGAACGGFGRGARSRLQPRSRNAPGLPCWRAQPMAQPGPGPVSMRALRAYRNAKRLSNPDGWPGGWQAALRVYKNPKRLCNSDEWTSPRTWQYGA